MNFEYSDKSKDWIKRVSAFMDKHVYPNVGTFQKQHDEGDRWVTPQIVHDLKAIAKKEGLWNMFMPPHKEHDKGEWNGAGLTNLEYAPLAEIMGRVSFASEVFNCSAPDTGNMEVLHYYGTEEQKVKWLRPLMNGEIRSAFLMTEPAVASSDATNIETRSSARAMSTSSTAANGGRRASATATARSPSSWASPIPTPRSTSSSRRSSFRSTRPA